ncbi:MocR-like pyridoxine biosynthesis transcription factor PdxR [Roseovarius aestuarii]|uniref:HTH-type transcriptional regulatory protein GabR n=1 Tax=Roseovarius aestuarii TaxID=475083 RepID=A0A1X7BUQ0_9RHOB|nr:PLP-dependent aminotransferase family protein [Roseovarius aestuarii]SMC13303.1 HTH-type transcriptional regulatory protein GabR [Roseovarius aestuarii]
MSNIENKHNANLNRDLFAISLDPAGNTSLQAQLLEALRAIIVTSQNLTGARLPASRILAAELSISRTTVQVVYDQMISEGYLVTRRGSGTYVAHDITHLRSPTPQARPARPVLKPWQPFQTGLPDQSLLPYQTWARQLERAWRTPEPDLLMRPDPLGWYPLREAIADHLAAWRNLHCDPEQVFITSGAWEALEGIFCGLVGSGKTVAVEDPCWPKTHDILRVTGCKIHAVRIDAEGLDAGKIPDDVSAVIVTPSRHYPTGLNLPLSRRTALLDWAKRTGALVIEDDYDSEFRYRGQPLPSLSGLDGRANTIYLGSFSKLVSPALRIGYLVVPIHLLDQIRRHLGRVGPRASLIPQPALATFMQSGEFAIHLRRMRRTYARRQSHLLDALQPVSDLLDLQPDPSGMHLCLSLKPQLARRVSDQEICRRAKKIGLHVGALSDHCVLPDKMQGLLLGYAAFDEQALSEAADRFANLLRSV